MKKKSLFFNFFLKDTNREEYLLLILCVGLNKVFEFRFKYISFWWIFNEVQKTNNDCVSCIGLQEYVMHNYYSQNSIFAPELISFKASPGF
jgi:hypothetical protein